MQATFIPSSEINTDLGVVNAARVSLGKKHDVFDKESDTKLIQYLAKNNHWTPFAHGRLYFELGFQHPLDMLKFHFEGNMAGFQWLKLGTSAIYKGSLYSWLCNLQHLPERFREFIVDNIYRYYPETSRSFIHPDDVPSFTYGHNCKEISEEYVINNKWWKIACATLLIKVPIFIARQIRTSQVGFSYSDLYVEPESFVFNEVSRRYVNDEPEFYQIDKWRVREGNRVKQGSTGIAADESQDYASTIQRNIILSGLGSYNALLREDNIAPEQLRALLPQSMYTEFYMTGTLHRWAQWLDLRLDPHVQEETRVITSRILDTLAFQFPEWRHQYSKQTWLYSYIAE